MSIIDFAKESFRQSGIPQWQNGYPNAEVLLEDMRCGSSYTLELDGAACATAAFFLGDDPTYAYIENGAWKSSEPYAVIHRIAISGQHRRMGLASLLIRRLEQLALEKGYRHVRIDTHEKNTPMRSTLVKNGFTHRGTIYLPDGSPRFAYEKELSL